MAKTLAKLTFSIAALVAATSFGTSTSRAYGDAPWCAVINIGTGTVYWDCQYPTFEACYHLGNILAGNRGFCNLNLWPGPSRVVPYRHPKRPRAILISARRIAVNIAKLPELMRPQSDRRYRAAAFSS